MNHAAITKRSAIRLTTGLLGLLASACNSSLPQATPAPTARPEKRRDVPAPPRPVAGTITIGIGSDAQTLQPLLARDTASAAYIATHYNAPLMRRNPETLDWDPTYGTAAGVVIGDQGRTLRFTLKPGLQWSDGKPLTVHDYRYTYARMSDPSTLRSMDLVVVDARPGGRLRCQRPVLPRTTSNGPPCVPPGTRCRRRVCTPADRGDRSLRPASIRLGRSRAHTGYPRGRVLPADSRVDVNKKESGPGMASPWSCAFITTRAIVNANRSRP
ncbi:MAG: hypothetical protein EBT22_07190 [Chloroflexi bacterium]|nr:hypothetical protein [Chloroflexota bacterium]